MYPTPIEAISSVALENVWEELNRSYQSAIPYPPLESDPGIVIGLDRKL
jgi:hypothetical protein